LSVTIIPTFICIRDRPHSAVQHNVAKENAEKPLCFVVVVLAAAAAAAVFVSLFACLFFIVMMIVLDQFFPMALSRLTLAQEGKQTSQEPASTSRRKPEV